MNILFLTNNPEVTDSLYNWLQIQESNIIWFDGKINPLFILKNNISFVISYNYKYIIKPDILKILSHKVINLHISLLPWNRGSDPNIWSFIDNTPCGVTIHEIDEGLDTGGILLQKSISFDTSIETLKSSYEKLHELLQTLFIKNWDKIKINLISVKKQNAKGTYHIKKDLNSIYQMIDYNIRIDELLKLLPPGGQ